MNHDGCTALWFACFYGRANVAHLLMEAGADWTIANKAGKGPLTIAKEQGREACRLLLEVREARKAWEVVGGDGPWKGDRFKRDRRWPLSPQDQYKGPEKADWGKGQDLILT